MASRFLALRVAQWLTGMIVMLSIEGQIVAREVGAEAIELLPPTGPLAIGRTSLPWVAEPGDQAASQTAAKRELIVNLWYPAKPDASRAPAPYIPSFSVLRDALGEAVLREAAGASYEALSSARTHAGSDLPVSPDSARYPVLLLSHGLRFNSIGYSMLAEDLASHGYVVIGVDHPATAFAIVFPDGRISRFAESLWTVRRTPEETVAFERDQVNSCGEDLVFVLRQFERLESGEVPSSFKGRLDLDRVGVLGHSFGGRVAARACQLDKRLKAGAILDGFGRTMTVEKKADGSTIEQPMMIQYARRVPASGIPRLLALMQTPGRDLEKELGQARREFCESVVGGSYELTLSTPGIVHESFSDIPLLSSGQSEEGLAHHRRAMQLIRGYTRAFFDRHVRGLAAALLDNSPAASDDVELTRHTLRGP